MKKKRVSLSTLGISLILVWAFLCSYVFIYCKIVAIGYRMEEAKKRFEELDMINKNCKAEILMLSSPENLLKNAKMRNMELVNPSRWCYVDIEIDKNKGTMNDTAEAGTR
ncbi:MAG: hypothetical protein JW957_02850 [Candidatus Omnitrophica bacterium]|nr:hypothetical protein [Candidatus Omnitrophota bacterium]